MQTDVLRIHTGAEPITDLTRQVREFCAGHGDGLLSVYAPHATAGLALVETGDGSEPDVVDALNRLLPPDDRYNHHHGSPGHGANHVLPVLVSPSLTIPVLDGEPALGTWQSVVLIDLNVDNPARQVRLSLLPG